jgi:predicted RNase H-like HicB family nuclease
MIRFVARTPNEHFVKRLFAYMTSNQLKAKIVRVIVERGREGLYYAQSPDLKGLLVARSSIDELRRQIPIAIREMFEVCDTPVVVSELDGPDEDSWVAIPTALIESRFIAS